MANFDQNITIDLKVKTKSFKSQLKSAAAEVQGVKESLEGVDTDLDSTADSLDNVADSASGFEFDNNIVKNFRSLKAAYDPSLFRDMANGFDDLSGSTGGFEFDQDLESAFKFDQDLETPRNKFQFIDEAILDVAKSQEKLNKSSSNLRFDHGLVNQSIGLYEKFKNSTENATESVKTLERAQENLTTQTKDTTESTNIETDSFEDMMASASNLSEAKDAVTNSNKVLDDQAEETRREIARESDVMQNMGDSSFDLEKALDSLLGKQKNYSDSNNKLSESAQEAEEALKRLRRSTDRSTSSMTAASDASELFEDGIGALSVNIGAFTIALRNFLTQIPLLLTGLGAIASAALGGASAFAVLGGAIAGAVGAGFLGYAQQLVEEVESIEDIGQAMQVIFSSVIDLFEKAAAPLLELADISFYLRWAVEGLATGIYMLSSAIADLLVGGENLQEFADAVGEDLFTINDAIESFDGSSWRNITESLMEAWVLLGEEVTWALGAVNNAIARSIRRSAELLNNVEDLDGVISGFSDTLSQLAELGFTIGSGLVPVFQMFSEVVRDVATFINNMDSEIVSGIITMGALTVVVSRISGAFASIINIGPSIVGTLIRISTTAKAANTNFGALASGAKNAAGSFLYFLNNIGLFGGVFSLVESIQTLDEANRAVGLSTTTANAKFKALAVASDLTADEIKDLAIQSKFGEERMEDFAEKVDHMEDSLRRTAIQSALTEKELEQLNKTSLSRFSADIDLDDSEGLDVNEFNEGLEDSIVPKNIFSNLNKEADLINEGMTDVKRNTEKATGGIKGIRAASTTAAKDITLLTAMTEALSWSQIKTTYTSNGLKAAIKTAGAQISTAIVQTVAYIGSLFGLTSAKLTAAGAAVALRQALDYLTLGTLKIVGAVITLIGILGALAVGATKNSETIMGAFSSIVGGLRTIFGGIAKFLMVTFTAIWEAIRMTLSPIAALLGSLANALGLAGDSAEGTSTIMEILKISFDLFLDAISSFFRLIGLVGNILMRGLIFPLQLTVTWIAKGVNMFGNFMDAVANFITSWGPLKGLFSDTASEADGVLDLILIVLQDIDNAIDNTMQSIEDTINSAIENMNEILEKAADTIPGFEFEGFSKVDLTRDEATSTEEAEVDSGTSPEFNMNVDKSTNIDQTVNADPEDKAQISRIAKDAIREANSFGRRTQGSQ